MNPERFRQTQLVFDQAMLRPPPDREAFVTEACAGDDLMRDHVTRMINYTREEDGPQPAAPEPGNGGLFIGGPAPPFDLPCTSEAAGRQRVALADFRGRWVVLVFYPRDFSLICPTELSAISRRREDFRTAGAEILGISVDSVDSHERWLATPGSRGGLGGLSFPLASDESGVVSRAYGVYLEEQHLALRGLFIVDPNGVLQFGSVHNLSIGRRTEDILRVLSALQTGGLCAENWTPGLPTVDPIEALRPGSIVSHYRIEERIGTGACGCVFRARDIMLERAVALKVIKPDGPLAPDAILAEARAAAGLNHTNVCTVYAVDETEGIPFIAMEHVQGRPLGDIIDDGPLAPQAVADIGGQIARGMGAAHAMGVVHGDLKPANVVQREDGVIKILDFGLARAGMAPADADGVASWVSSGSGLRGTPAYMSPEQAAGARASRHGDVFSLGVMLYEMLTGESPFPGPGIEEILEQVRATEADRFAAAVPEPFSSIIGAAMVREAGDRTITMDEIAKQLV